VKESLERRAFTRQWRLQCGAVVKPPPQIGAELQLPFFWHTYCSSSRQRKSGAACFTYIPGQGTVSMKEDKVK
jgi:hypothetical protein